MGHSYLLFGRVEAPHLCSRLFLVNCVGKRTFCTRLVGCNANTQLICTYVGRQVDKSQHILVPYRPKGRQTQTHIHTHIDTYIHIHIHRYISTDLGFIIASIRLLSLLFKSLSLNQRLIQLCIRVTQLALAAEQLKSLSQTRFTAVTLCQW